MYNVCCFNKDCMTRIHVQMRLHTFLLCHTPRPPWTTPFSPSLPTVRQSTPKSDLILQWVTIMSAHHECTCMQAIWNFMGSNACSGLLFIRAYIQISFWMKMGGGGGQVVGARKSGGVSSSIEGMLSVVKLMQLHGQLVRPWKWVVEHQKVGMLAHQSMES